MGDTSDFTKSHFDKLLLTFLVLFFASIAVHAVHYGEPATTAFATDNGKLFAGALLTLITGQRFLQRGSDGNGGGTNGDKNGKNKSEPNNTHQDKLEILTEVKK